MSGQILADQASSFQAMRDRVTQVVKIVMEDPAVDSVERLRRRRQRLQQGASCRSQLKPLEERDISSDEVIARLRPKLAPIPGASVFLQSVQDLRIGGRGSRGAISIHACKATTCAI